MNWLNPLKIITHELERYKLTLEEGDIVEWGRPPNILPTSQREKASICKFWGTPIDCTINQKVGFLCTKILAMEIVYKDGRDSTRKIYKSGLHHILEVDFILYFRGKVGLPPWALIKFL